MIGALAGGDALEIIVQLKDLSEAGFKKVEGSLHHMESTANGVNTSGFSKAAKGMEKDANAAAGLDRKGGGIAGLASGLTGLGGGPVTLAVGGLVAVAGAGMELEKAYQVVENREKGLAQALKNHGESLDALRPKIDDAISQGEQYGYNANDVEGAITSLTEANLNFQQVQEALPRIMDLARAKNLDMATAADAYSKAVYGNAKMLKQFGVILPPITASAADTAKAVANLQRAQEGLGHAQDNLILVTDALSKKQHLSLADQFALQAAHQAVTDAIAKHGAKSDQARLAEQKLTDKEILLSAKMKLTTADAIKLKDAHQKVTDATDKVTAAQHNLTLAQQGGLDKGARLTMINKDLSKAIGDQRNAVTPLQQAQAKLSDAWEHMATVVGPGLEDLFTKLIQGVAALVSAISDLINGLFNIGHAKPDPNGTLAIIQKGGQSAVNAYRGSGGLGFPQHASGGWVGLHGPEIGLLGEKGPEYVIPNDQLRSGGGTGGGRVIEVHTHLHLDEQQIAHVVNRVLGSDYNLGGSAAFGFGGS